MSIDVIILSYAHNDETTALTRQTLTSLFSAEPPGKFNFNVLVIESNKKLKPYQYPQTTTIYPNQAFNFNKYLNIGIKATSADYICFCNNDLYFNKNWASNLFAAMEDQIMLCASTYWEWYHDGERGVKPDSGNFSGYRDIFSGWCFVIKRTLLDTIGLFDEKINFWYSDDDFCNTLQQHGVENFLITNASVTHLIGRSLDQVPSKKKKRLTIIPLLYFQYKWQHRSKIKYYALLVWHKLKIAFLKN